MNFAFAPPFGSAIDVDEEIGDAGGKHHRRLGAGATKQNNRPDRKIEGVVDKPNPPRFGVAHDHQDNTTKVDAVGSGVKPTQTLAWNKAEKIADAKATDNTTDNDDNGSFEGEFATLDLARSVRMFAPLPEAPKRKRDASENVKTSGAKELVLEDGVTHESIVDDTKDVLDTATLRGEIS